MYICTCGCHGSLTTLRLIHKTLTIPLKSPNLYKLQSPDCSYLEHFIGTELYRILSDKLLDKYGSIHMYLSR